MAKAKTEKTLVDFEHSLAELNQMVELIEQGGLGLEEALKKFEQGIKLARQCQTALQTAEQKVRILIEQNAQPVLAPFTSELNSDSD